MSHDYEAHEQSTIWFPGIYQGAGGPYAKPVDAFPEETIISLVQERAREDGEWAIENGRVGDNEDKMRKMMEWVSDETNIRQCLEHIRKEAEEMSRFDDYEPRTVDYICRDLANASKWIGGGNARG